MFGIRKYMGASQTQVRSVMKRMGAGDNRKAGLKPLSIHVMTL